MTILNKEQQIEPFVVIYDDLIHCDVWPLLDGYELVSSSTIGVIRFIARQLGIPREMATLYDVAISMVMDNIFRNASLKEYKVWLFLSHSSWQPKSRLSLYKRLWKSLSDEALKQFPIGTEVLFESAEGVRFAGITQVEENTFPLAIELLRKYSSAIIISREDTIADEQSIKLIFSAAFPAHGNVQKTSVDWPNLVMNLCQGDSIVIRTSGSYDDRQASIDCFMSSERMSLFSLESYAIREAA